MNIPKGVQFIFIFIPVIIIVGILLYRYLSKDKDVQSFSSEQQENVFEYGDTIVDIEEFSYDIIEEGTGEKALIGDNVSVHYTGRLTDGSKFDSSYDRGVPFEFTLGSGQVIRGWDEGVKGMVEGEKRTLYIPSSMGYGDQGAGNLIPGEAGLIFDVELIEVK